MNKKIKVLIADDNYDFGITLRRFLSKDEEIEVVGIARDGEEAYTQIITQTQDECFIAIIMTTLDGIGVLN